jgi:hypothetical protein
MHESGGWRDYGVRGERGRRSSVQACSRSPADCSAHLGPAQANKQSDSRLGQALALILTEHERDGVKDHGWETAVLDKLVKLMND